MSLPLPGHRSRVDVVVPCYNYERYLRECVESVLVQADVDVRVLIIDDASTDAAASVAAEIAAADPRVEFRRHAVNVGHIKTYNEGLEWVTGTYAVLLDADDMLTPGSLRRACALLEAHPEVGFVYGQPLVFDGAHPHSPNLGASRWKIWPGRDWIEMRCRLAENCIRSPEVVMRGALLRRLGGFRDELPHTADFEMWMRFASYADVGYVAGPHQAFYRLHPMNMHVRQFGTLPDELPQFSLAFEILFRDHGCRLGDISSLETMARRQLAKRALRSACRSYDRGPVRPLAMAALEEFALTTYRQAISLKEHHGLRWRRRLGARVCRALDPFLTAATLPARLYRMLERRRLQKAGL